MEVNERESILYAGILIAVILTLACIVVPILDRAFPELFTWLTDPKTHGWINTDQWSVAEIKP